MKDDGCCYVVDVDWGKITGLSVTEITDLPDLVTIPRFGLPAMRRWPAIRRYNIGGTVHKCINVEALLPVSKDIPGGDYLTRYLLQCVLSPDSAVQALGLNEQVPLGRYTTTSGQFVSQRFYKPEVGEMRAIVIGATPSLCDESIARIMGVSRSTVIKLAGPGNFLKIPGKYLLTPIDPTRCETYIRPEAAIRVLKAGATSIRIAKEIEDWIEDELLDLPTLVEAGAVVSIRGLHRVLDSTSGFGSWIEDRVGRTLAAEIITNSIDAIPVTFAEQLVLVERVKYVDWVVWLLLRDGGVCHGGSVGETADESLMRIQPVFPDGNGKVSARALHAFLGTKRTFEAWLDVHSGRAGLGQTATKSSSRVRGDVLLSEEEALALLLQSIKDPADFRTTLTPSTKL